MLENYTLFLNISFVCFILATLFFLLSVIFNKKSLQLFALIPFITGLTSTLLSIIIRGLVSGHIPMSNTYETLVLLSTLIALIYLSFMKVDKDKIIATGCSLLIVIVIALASLVSDIPRPLVPALKSNWLTIHVLFCFISYAAFAIAFITGLLYFIVGKKKPDIDFDQITYNNIILGYTFLILGITSGSVWGEQAWGSYWNWDPKETWSLITLFIYTIYLHLRLNKKCSKAKCLLLSILGFFFIIFTYFGVNFLMTGLHSYS